MTTQLEQSDATRFYRNFFLVAALYDGILGLLFFVLYGPIYRFFSIPLPENLTYLQMISAFVFVQGVGYWYVSRNPMRNVDLVKVGSVYKAGYVLVSLAALANGQLPHTIFAWFAACDVLFLIGFVRFLMLMRPATHGLAPQA
jgi:hypothetical protein